MSQTSDDSSSDSDMNNNDDYKFWSRCLDRHYIGEYSFAAIKGKSVMEDYSQVVVGPEATFVGVYDGHGGHQTSKYVSDNIFNNLMSCVEKHSTLSKEVLKEAFLKTEANWVIKLPEQFKGQELIAASSSGSSCLVGIMWKASLYVANVGNTSSIMVQRAEGSSEIEIQPLTSIQGKSVKSFIGDVHQKYKEHNFMGKNIFVSNRPDQTSDPSLVELPISPFNGEKFIIFGSSGFWKLMRIKDAAELVVGLPWKGIAAVLIKEALVKAATKMGKTYEDFLSTKDHDDITVIVLFFYRNLEVRDIQEQMSVRVGGSYFSALEKISRGR